MRKTPKKKLKKINKKVSNLNINVGSKVKFLFPGWVCPKYILSGTVTNRLLQGSGSSARYLYHIHVKSQDVFPIDCTDAVIPDMISKFDTCIVDDCISRVKLYKELMSLYGTSIYTRVINNNGNNIIGKGKDKNATN